MLVKNVFKFLEDGKLFNLVKFFVFEVWVILDIMFFNVVIFVVMECREGIVCLFFLFKVFYFRLVRNVLRFLDEGKLLYLVYLCKKYCFVKLLMVLVFGFLGFKIVGVKDWIILGG